MLGGPHWADFVEKVEKSSVTKTRQIAIRWNIAAQHYLRPVEDLARCPIDKLAGPPADFLNAALVGLPKNRTSPKGSFSTQSADSGRSRDCDLTAGSTRSGRSCRHDIGCCAPEAAIEVGAQLPGSAFKASPRGVLWGIDMRQMRAARDRLDGLHSSYPIETQPMTAVRQTENAAKHGRYRPQPGSPRN